MMWNKINIIKYFICFIEVPNFLNTFLPENLLIMQRF